MKSGRVLAVELCQMRQRYGFQTALSRWTRFLSRQIQYRMWQIFEMPVGSGYGMIYNDVVLA